MKKGRFWKKIGLDPDKMRRKVLEMMASCLAREAASLRPVTQKDLWR